MNTFSRSDYDDFLLSGEPVVRLWGRDYGEPTAAYAEQLLEIANMYAIDLQIKELIEPPGVIVRAYLGKPPPKLVDPVIVVNNVQTPWLFCSVKDDKGQRCENRIKEGYPPNSICALHEGVR